MECTAGIGQKGWFCGQKLWSLQSKWNTLWVLDDGRENSGMGGGRLCMRLCSVVFDLTLWIVAQWAPLFIEFSRQEHWSRLPFPPPGESSRCCTVRLIVYHEPPGNFQYQNSSKKTVLGKSTTALAELQPSFEEALEFQWPQSDSSENHLQRQDRV